MVHEYDTFSVAESNVGVVFRLLDGSSVEVPQATVRRSAVLQEAIQTSHTAANMSITLPRGALQDWLQSADALKAAATSTTWTTGHGTDIAHILRLLQLLRVRCFIFCGKRGAKSPHAEVV